MNLKSAMLSLLVVGVFALTVVTFIKNKPAKVVYVNMDELFNGFQMKKELENDFLSKTNQIQKQIETLRIKVAGFKEEVSRAVSTNYVDSLNSANAKLTELNIQFQENYAPLKDQYDSQIQNQLLNYMKQKIERFRVFLEKKISMILLLIIILCFHKQINIMI